MDNVVLNAQQASVVGEIIHKVIEKGLKPEELIPYAAVYQVLITQLEKIQKQRQKAQEDAVLQQEEKKS